ncbi:hypothetical protein F4780DRAFT_687084 [Xylariomycetidae sp. FL0641]|nr:hypothetical protein F4780DRAFT_687084 [Xylariomycetidae sp. FL0641]
MEVAGLVLGGLPLVLMAAEKGAKLANNVFRVSTVQNLRLRVFTQQEQMNVTIANLGLVDPTPEELFECVRERYPAKYPHFLEIIKHMDKATTKLMSELEIKVHEKPRWTDDPPERAPQVWRRVLTSLRRNTIQDAIDDLQKWNTALQRCFEKVELPQLGDDDRPSLVRVRSCYDWKQCNQLRKNASTLHRAISTACCCNGPVSHGGNLKLTWHREKRLTPGIIQLALSSDSPTAVYHCDSWRDFQATLTELKDLEENAPTNAPVPTLDTSQAVFPLPSPSRLLGRKKIQRGASTGAVFTDQSVPKKKTVGIVQQPNQATSTKSIACLPEPCLFSKIQTAFDHYALPAPCEKTELLLRKTAQSETRSVTLRSLLAQKHVSKGASPGPLSEMTLADRLAVCAGLCWGVLFLSGSPWLPPEKKWMEHINFLWHEGSPDVYCPAVSSLFANASNQKGKTSDPSDESTEQDRFHNSQICNQTVFSLGIILVELSLGEPFDEIRARGEAPGSTGGVLDEYQMAKEQIQRIYKQLGHTYGDAIQRCIKCSFSGRDSTHSFEFEQFRHDFFREVVVPVQTTYQHMRHLF